MRNSITTQDHKMKKCGYVSARFLLRPEPLLTARITRFIRMYINVYCVVESDLCKDRLEVTVPAVGIGPTVENRELFCFLPN